MTSKNIHLIFKTHLDIGFTHYAARVRDHYHQHFIPMAIETGEYLWEENEDNAKFVWTTGAWLIHEHLESGSAAERRKLEKAIERGIITWHALPYTTHTELLSANLFKVGLRYSQDLDAWFGRKTTGAKMTDVPGHTIGMVPLMAEAGIRFLHIGVNSASAVPSVPPIFRWQAATGDEIVVLYQNDYGATYFPDGLVDGIAFAHTVDNLGPQSVSQVIESHRLLALEHPDAEIHASTLSEFGNVAWSQREKFPLIESEIADSWIHGVGTAPAKVARFLALRRLFDDWAQSKLTPQRLKFARQLIMVAEHTWGVDIKTFLRDQSAWERNRFEHARKSDARFALTEKSWQEQNQIIDQAIHELSDVDQSIAKLTVKSDIPVPVFSECAKRSSLPLQGGEIDFDQTSGGLSSIQYPNGITVSASQGLFSVLSYQSYDAQDYKRYLDSYLTQRSHWALQDHDKPGLENAATARSEIFLPHWQGATADKHNGIVSKYHFDVFAVDELGAPAAPEIHYCFTDSDTLKIAVCFRDKPANRMPEASFITFAPDVDPSTWRFKKLGYIIDPKSVVHNGNRQLHAVESVQAMLADDYTLSITPLDCPLAGPAEASFLPFYQKEITMSKGVRFNLHNNKWGTNFPMWCEGSFVFRFEIRLQGG